MIKFEKMLTAITKGMAWISGITLVVMMLLTVFNVVARPIHMAPVGIPELVGYGMVIVVCFGLAYTAILQGNVAVEMFVNLFPKKIKETLNVLMSILAVGFFSTVIWQGISLAFKEYRLGDYSPILEFSVTPIRVVFVLGFFMLCVVLLLDILKSIRELFK